jgi:uncharacterized protein YdcH (DUF465 family)
MDAHVAGPSSSDLLTSLLDEHRRLDQRLKAMDGQLSLTSAERLEYARLKKQKLLTKDRIARLQTGA